jgi:hypothetical protein
MVTLGRFFKWVSDVTDNGLANCEEGTVNSLKNSIYLWRGLPVSSDRKVVGMDRPMKQSIEVTVLDSLTSRDIYNRLPH